MRNKRLFYNSITSLIYQLTTILCGLILPRLILNAYGSEVNGLVNSIIQFLGVIAFLELGVGTVIQSTLYKPLAENDTAQISRIVSSSNRFFGRLGRVLLAYVAALVIFYPRFAGRNFDYPYTATLIVAISISYFAQFYFGVTNRLLLTADQRGYIQHTVKTVAVVCNTIACFFMIRMGCGIHAVKLVTSLSYLLQPFVLWLYVRGHYRIDRHIRYTGEPIAQKWNGFAQHIAESILEGTDTIVLTMLATLPEVSIYSIYYQIIRGIKQLFLYLRNGITSLIGELWAKQELEELTRTFSWTEWAIHTGTTYLFGVMGVLIVPFVRVYTSGVHDANYIQPLFAALIVAANAGQCLGMPYHMVILAAGHYRQTQKYYLISTMVNIVISVVTVKAWGLIGVAVGTLTAMVYQALWMAAYVEKHLIRWPMRNFFRQVAVDLLTVAVGCLGVRMLSMKEVTYLAWVILALKTAAIWAIVAGAVNALLYPDKVRGLLRKLLILKPD